MRRERRESQGNLVDEGLEGGMKSDDGAALCTYGDPAFLHRVSLLRAASTGQGEAEKTQQQPVRHAQELSSQQLHSSSATPLFRLFESLERKIESGFLKLIRCQGNLARPRPVRLPRKKCQPAHGLSGETKREGSPPGTPDWGRN